MTITEFVARLTASYPPGLRPDAEYLNQILLDLRNKALSESQLDAAYDIIKESCRMFPVMSDINLCLAEAKVRITKGQPPEKAREYFNLNGYGYARDVEISADGELMRKALPEGATDYTISVPARFRVKEEFLSISEASERGYIDEKFYKVLKDKAGASEKSRFEKIGKILQLEQKEMDFDDL